METLSAILMLAAAVIGVVLLIKVLSAPIRWIFKLLLNAGLGFVALWIVNFFGDFVGLSIDMSFLNCLIVGFFGVPGVILLSILSFLL